MNKINNSGNVLANVGLGMQMALSILIFVFAGYWLDNYFDTLPLFLLFGVFIGLLLSFYYLFNEIKRLDEYDKVKKEKKEENRIKW